MCTQQRVYKENGAFESIERDEANDLQPTNKEETEETEGDKPEEAETDQQHDGTQETVDNPNDDDISNNAEQTKQTSLRRAGKIKRGNIVAPAAIPAEYRVDCF